MQSLLLLGRQPALGLAELESLYGADKVRKVGEQTAIVDVDPCLLAFDRLGGSQKFCKILTTLDTTHWGHIEKFLVGVAPGHAASMPPGKMQLGLSVVGLDIGIRQIEASGLTLKKAIRASGRSVRLVPNKTQELNSAQVIHNKLTGPTGWELVFIRDGKQTIVAQTVKVQDIESYSLRDRERPKRDSKVGMLPPKLAQIIINLAVGKLADDQLSNICEIPADQTVPRPHLNQTILDPFCGTGVILQEALLMGYTATGTDLEPRMVEYTAKNLQWLHEMYRTPDADQSIVEVGDATNYKWQSIPNFVACETYLGRPFTARPAPDILKQTVVDCNVIIKKFLNNIREQIPVGAALCVAVPAWQTSANTFTFLPLVDSLSDMGYNRISFEHVRDSELIYYRSDQIVARQLIVITKR